MDLTRSCDFKTSGCGKLVTSSYFSTKLSVSGPREKIYIGIGSSIVWSWITNLFLFSPFNLSETNDEILTFYPSSLNTYLLTGDLIVINFGDRIIPIFMIYP